MAATNADATVTVTMDGHEAIVRAAQAVGDAWRATGKSLIEGGKKLGTELGNVYAGLARDAASVATSASRINFQTGAASARDYGLTVARMAVSSGRDIEGLKAKYESLSKQTLMPEPVVAALGDSLRSLTYDAGFAVDSIKGISDEAEAIGQTPQQVSAFSASLHNAYGVSNDLAGSMGDIDRISQTIGNTGGVRALHDQLQAADGVMSRFKANVRDSAALLATLGKGLTAQQQQGTQQAVLGAIAGNRVGVEWLLRGTGQLGKGQSILNGKGEIEDQIGTVEKVRAALVKRYGDKRALQVARMTFGDVEGTAVMNFKADEARKAAAGAGAPEVGPPLPTAADLAARVRGTDAAYQLDTEQRRARNERKAGERVAAATQGVNRTVADNPELSPGAQAAANLSESFAREHPTLAAGVSVLALSRGKEALDAKQKELERRQAAGEIRKSSGWREALAGTYYSPVPEGERAQAAKEYADRRGGDGLTLNPALGKVFADALSNVTLTATVEQAPDGTVKGVRLGKQSAARQ